MATPSSPAPTPTTTLENKPTPVVFSALAITERKIASNKRVSGLLRPLGVPVTADHAGPKILAGNLVTKLVQSPTTPRNASSASTSSNDPKTPKMPATATTTAKQVLRPDTLEGVVSSGASDVALPAQAKDDEREIAQDDATKVAEKRNTVELSAEVDAKNKQILELRKRLDEANEALQAGPVSTVHELRGKYAGSQIQSDELLVENAGLQECLARDEQAAKGVWKPTEAGRTIHTVLLGLTNVLMVVLIVVVILK
ncbi:hypothetical protein EXIGLDRAFT_694955 [Exidia glandulosa HHB12029]|uniref:Uncharacterized protein n=1 Tax=Exidia glandulosa HHB12029 TaxID=1314781 RepID=A0A165G8F2_EXIGL|nr:hypothetical protein EXIGLDRAFT_694955 [Exidia glandulosa HHB12029]